jgi:hypothetical protein
MRCCGAIVVALVTGAWSAAQALGTPSFARMAEVSAAGAAADSGASASSDTLPPFAATSDTALADAPPEDALAGRDYEVERAETVAPSEVEMGYSLASLSHGRIAQRRRVRYREAGVEAEVREGRGDALSGAALGARVPGGWLALGRASPRWGRGLVLGTPAEPWRTRALLAPIAEARPREADAIEFRRPGAAGIDVLAARRGKDAFTAAALAVGPAALELALTRALDRRLERRLAGVRVAGRAGEAEAAMDGGGAWRVEAARFAGDGALSLALRLGHFDFRGVERARVAPPGAALGAALRGTPRDGLETALEGSLWRFPGGQTGHRGALEVRADMAHHESIAMGFEERRGLRHFTAGSATAGALRQGVWAEWRRDWPAGAMHLRHEWWGEAGGLHVRVRELASAEMEARPWRGTAASWSVWLYRSGPGDPQYVTESEIDRTIWRALSGAGHRTRLRVQVPAAGGSVRAALTVSQAGGGPRPAQWTLDWTRRARTR